MDCSTPSMNKLGDKFKKGAKNWVKKNIKIKPSSKQAYIL